MQNLLLRRRMMAKSGHPNFPEIISFVSPEGITPASFAEELGVDITTKIFEVGLPTAQYIYAVTTAGATHQVITGDYKVGARSYTWGDDATPPTQKTSGDVITWGTTTGRYVIFNDSEYTGVDVPTLPTGAKWGYFGKNTISPKGTMNSSVLKYIHISSESNISIVAGCFSSNIGLTGTLTIPQNVLSIGNAAFENCAALSGVNFNNIESVGVNSFSNRNIISSLTLQRVKTIDSYTFYGAGINNEVYAIVIGEYCTNIGNYSFGYQNYIPFGGSGKVSIRLDAITPPIIFANTFVGNIASMPIKVPAGSVAAYKAAPFWSDRAAYISAI